MATSLFYKYLCKVIDISVNLFVFLLHQSINLLLKCVSRKTIHKIFVDYRSLLIMLVIVPASFFYDLFARIRSWIVWSFFQTNVLHDVKVQNIQNQILEWRRNGATKKMCTNRSTWGSVSMRISNFKKNCNRIDLDLHDIIEVDFKKQTVRVEPGVNMGQITDHLNKLGWTLALTIEMEDLTVGGLINGFGLENNSHIYGMLYETAVAYEVVTSDGKVLTCTEQENSDLFKAIPGSHGTLAFLVSVDLKIIPCKKWMKVNYIPCYNQADFKKRITDLTTDRETCPQYVEALVYTRETAVVFTANYCDEPIGQERSKINRLNLWFKPFFYKYVEGFLQSGPDYDYVPIRDWMHRHTRSIFWELEDLVPFANSPLYRWTWGILGAPKISLLKSIWTKEIRNDLVYKHIVQDMVVPLKDLEDTINFVHDTFEVYPMLFYPVRIFPHDPEIMIKNPKEFINNDPKEGQMYFELGIYGVPKCVKNGRKYDGPAEIRKMDLFCREHNGFFFLYTDIFCTEEEFNQTFNFDLYNKCREKYNAKDAFPTIWEKVKPDFSTFVD